MRFAATMVVLAGLAGALFLASLAIGPAGVGPIESFGALLGGGNEAMVLVMQEIRLPRALLGLMLGVTLGLSGAAMQGYLRNPLAEPGLIGVTSAASLGAVISLQAGIAHAVPLALPAMALLGAGISVLLVLLLSGTRGGSLSLILAGIAVGAMAGALTSLVLNLSPNPYAAAEIVFWMLGSLADRSFTHVWLALPFMAVGWVFLALLGRSLDALSLGEDVAETVGVRLSAVRLMLVSGVAASVGAGVAVAGAVGFVGLVVPHILRPLVGAVPSRLLAASALGGGAMVLAADVAVRVIAPDRDLKLGVVTAIVGAPIFLHLIYRTRRDGR